MGAEILHCAHQPCVVLQRGGADFQPLGKGGHDGGANLGGHRLDEKLLLGGHPAADQKQLRVEQMNQTGQPAVRLTTGEQDAQGCMVVF